MPSEVTLPLPGGGRLAGLVELAGQSDCVLYVHGFGSDARGEKPAAVFAACARRGWGCAAFEFRGHGRSSGTMRDLRASGMQSDLRAVRDYLAERGVRRTFLIGSSMGGFAASWFALNEPSVPAVMLIAPAFRFWQRRWEELSEPQRRAWRETGVIRFRSQHVDAELEYGLIEDLGQFDADALADRVDAGADLHGMRDETVPWQDTLALVQRTPFGGIQLRLLGDGDHRLRAYAGEMAEEACRFFALVTLGVTRAARG